MASTDMNGSQISANGQSSQQNDGSIGSQTAEDYISSQLQLEADAREILPYQFDTCTYSLGPLRQSIFSCLTCNPPPSDPSALYSSAGVCYSCSISCHGEHELVELFTRRNFVCDCGTSRMPPTSSCSLRINNETSAKGGVHSEEPSATNTYNQNFRNRFCGCGEVYDPHTEKGTMYQCYGLGTAKEGGCDEDWWHPECVMGLPRDWHQHRHDANAPKFESQATGDIEDHLRTDARVPSQIGSDAEHRANGNSAGPDGDVDEHPVPSGFPEEEEFEHFICYKCTGAFPWIKRYCGAPGFLKAVPLRSEMTISADSKSTLEEVPRDYDAEVEETSKKRKANENEEDPQLDPPFKKAKSEDLLSSAETSTQRSSCTFAQLPPAPDGPVSLFLKEDFRDHLCRCPTCFPLLAAHPHLLEEEIVYEPPMSETASNDGDGTPSVGSRSLLDRGEAALSNMDRVKAIEGVMVYNRLRDKVKDFLKPFAESGQPVGAEDVKKYFEKLRGDDEAMKMAYMRGNAGGGGNSSSEGDHRKEQGGY